jgi:hypothetical protein
MEPLNTKERTIGLLKFIGLFLVLFVLAIVAISFDFKLPKKQIQLLREENARLSADNVSKKSVVVLVDSLNSKMLRYDTETNKVFIETQINSDINRLITVARDDSSDFGFLLANISKEYLRHLDDKKKIGDGASWSEKIADRDKEIADLKTELKGLKRDYEMLKLYNATSR